MPKMSLREMKASEACQELSSSEMMSIRGGIDCGPWGFLECCWNDSWTCCGGYNDPTGEGDFCFPNV